MNERAETISAARNVDENFDANVRDLRGQPGPFEGIGDIELAYACHAIGANGFADAEAGSVDYPGGHLSAVGRWILRTDPLGFHSLHETANADDAVILVETSNYGKVSA